MEIEPLRTESSITYANPDGTLTEESTTGPVRVKDESGDWQDVDTTLVFRNGAVQPKQAAAEIQFSDGGEGPLAHVTEGTKSLGLGWDGPLPRPVLDGNTATYKNVQPNADLVVTALPEGFSHLLILNERPTERVELRIPVAAEGLKLRETADERLLWESADGKDIAAAPVPMMWGADERPAANEPEHVSDVTASVEGPAGDQTLVLKPDSGFLKNPDVTYPVTIDPTNTLLGPLTDTWVQDAAYPTSQRGSTELKAGTYNGTERARSYLKFDTSRFADKNVVDADLRLFSHWSSSCSTDNAGIQVRRVTSDWDPSGITWSAQPATTSVGAPVSKVAKGYNATCPGGHVSWDVDGIVQAWADGQPNYGVRLAAVDETDPLTWRRYRSSNYVDGSHDSASEPSLIVTYNSTPAVPTNLAVNPLRTEASLPTVSSLTPTLQAKVADLDAGSTLTAEFQVEPDPGHADTTYTWTGKTAQAVSGALATVQIPTSAAVPDGAHLRIRARSSDGVASSAWSGWLAFRVDANAVLPADVPQHLQSGATDTPSPLVSGVVTSPNGGMVEAQFRLHNGATTQTLGTQLVPNGERAGFQIPAENLATGGPFAWSMRGCYAGKCSAWTANTAIATNPVAQPAASTAGTSVVFPLTKATVCTDSETCTGTTGSTLKVGTVSGKNWRGYLKADVSGIPAGATVVDAKLQLTAGTTVPEVSVHALNAPWATSETGAALDNVTAPGANVEATAPWAVDVTGLVIGWTGGADANHGIVLRKPEGASAAEGITFTEATLTVKYEAAVPPSAPVAPHSRPGDGGALVTWGTSKESGYEDTALTYHVTAVDSTGTTVAQRTTNGTAAVFTGLDNGASYTFAVRASSPYGSSPTVTTNTVAPLEAPLAPTVYRDAVNEYLTSTAALVTGAKNTSESAVAGRPNAALYSTLLATEESWLIDTRDALRSKDLVYTGMASTLSEVLAMPAADGTVILRATVLEKKTAADMPSEPEQSEGPYYYSFSSGTSPKLRSKASAGQVEQRLATDESAFTAVVYGTVDNDGPGSTSPPQRTAYTATAPSSTDVQIAPFASISANGTAQWARNNWNARHDYPQDCTNYISKALHFGGGMRMKGVNKDKKNVDNWYRTKHMSPPHSGGGMYYLWSHTWTVADNMERFLSRNSNGAVYQESHQRYAAVGDVVFFNWGGKGGWDHAGVVTKMAGGKAYVSAHNNNRLNQRLDVYVQSQRGTWANIVRVKPRWY
ncbi:DNRLRE domain-containing protein [Streptomyces lateritius]|uniref:DNRLRE domain-containing protein n=1 Tax=Streptomyces lateritius TaxID=67313 RepID=UPI001C8C0079|nr:DNRLRE domain-containing protein [Streptomyces lateritius]MBX9420903.1 DNRLRE domain-containing protein [Streptomyces lateritius]